MAKTRRKKINKSPQRPYPTATAHVAVKGEQVTTTGVRGRTEVLRVGGRAVRHATLTVPPAKSVGDRKPKGIFVGRTYTGVARSKPYPVRGAKRGGSALKPVGLMARAAKAVKKVVVGDAR